MKRYLLKFSIITFFLALAFCFGLTGRRARANEAGPPAQRTGAPGEQTCAISGCHTSFAVNSGSGVLTLTGLPANGYSATTDYNLTVTLNQASRQRYGFEIVVIDSQGRQAGTLTVTDNSRTLKQNSVVGSNLRQYISHNFGGVIPNGTNQGSWNFRWTSPATSTGTVTFYVAGNAANGTGDESGDFIYTRSFTLAANAGPQAVANVSAASFAQSPFAADGIVALFAAGGLTGGASASASSVPLPTTLAGVQVLVKDANNVERPSGLFFVSDAQINYTVPTGTANGAATITVTRNGTPVGAGTFTVASVAPGLFTANANGQGVPAAVLFRQKADGTQSIETITIRNTAGQFDPAPIDLGPSGDIVILIGFGTGFRGRTALNNVSAVIGGTNAEVQFASAQGDLAGLDQTNILLPRGLIGRGLVNLVMTVDGKSSNTMQLSFK